MINLKITAKNLLVKFKIIKFSFNFKINCHKFYFKRVFIKLIYHFNKNRFLKKIYPKKTLEMNNTSLLIGYINGIGKETSLWIARVTVPLGILLNMISVYIFLRPNLNKTNMGFYNLNISIWNTIVLLHYLLIFDPKIMAFNYNFEILNEFNCKMYYVTTRVLRQVPTWLEALITFDRYLSVCHHGKCLFIKKKQNIILIMIFMITFLIIVGIPNFLFHLETQISFVNTSNLTTKSVKCTTIKEIVLETSVSAVIFKIIIPGILIIIFSILLLQGVKNSKSNLKQSTNKKSTKEKELESSILWMNLIFLILNVPVAVMYTVKSIYDNLIMSNDLIKIAVINNIYFFTTDIANLYYSLMFFTFLAFNRIFRCEILAILLGYRSNYFVGK